MKRTNLIVGLAALGSALGGSLMVNSARADFIADQPLIGAPVYIGTQPTTFDISGPADTIVQRIELRIPPPQLEAIAVPVPGPANFAIDSFFDIFTELSIDGGATWSTNTGPGPSNPVDIRFETVDDGQPGGVTTIQTEMLQLNLSGGTFPSGHMLRESPTLQSLGTTTITDIGGGLYRIDSFFDVFTELSIDGGASWTPASGPMHLVGLPEPSSALLLTIGAGAIMARMRRRR